MKISSNILVEFIPPIFDSNSILFEILFSILKILIGKFESVAFRFRIYLKSFIFF